MKAQILKSNTAIAIIVLAAFALAFSSCGRGIGCPGLITKAQPQAQKEVRS